MQAATERQPETFGGRRSVGMRDPRAICLRLDRRNISKARIGLWRVSSIEAVGLLAEAGIRLMRRSVAQLRLYQHPRKRVAKVLLYRPDAPGN